ncbi:hypothetical protein BAUCODRAFT_548198 [Baudoinia panamericana UAMH 10762]|uniref:Uncharacterized protein n=1 Tax=Baudoinia panamericana (strain UAMH 10762) TaxID=717646 RepID=M2LJN1_BAUPA|nr:uncharacterized protein BAUCODRAFT_548198 [Baudoinia panamericana UAMH 10762]EMC94432.1 hypothetical protein BAUCODRAFT_548198 [Baudoinia panamericana UAMH 10762]
MLWQQSPVSLAFVRMVLDAMKIMPTTPKPFSSTSAHPISLVGEAALCRFLRHFTAEPQQLVSRPYQLPSSYRVRGSRQAATESSLAAICTL